MAIMKVVRTYSLRTQAEEAATFLMSKGIASNVHASGILKNFSTFAENHDGIELEVQDSKFERAQELLTQRESALSAALPNLNFLGIGKKKKSR